MIFSCEVSQKHIIYNRSPNFVDSKFIIKKKQNKTFFSFSLIFQFPFVGPKLVLDNICLFENWQYDELENCKNFSCIHNCKRQQSFNFFGVELQRTVVQMNPIQAGYSMKIIYVKFAEMRKVFNRFALFES